MVKLCEVDFIEKIELENPNLNRSSAMAEIAKDDMNIGVSCAELATRHNHSVSRPNGHFLYKTCKKMDYSFKKYNYYSKV